MSNTENKPTEHHHSLHDVVDSLKHRMHDAGHKLTDAGHTVSHTLSDASHKVGDAVLHQRLALCTACHAELAPEDVAQGCCSDKDACGCRAFSARCW